MTDAATQKALWEVRKAGLNIMMSMKGDGKPVSFIEDCAVPLQHLAEYVDRLTRVFAQHGTRGTWYAHAWRDAARAADPRHAPRRRGEDARDRRGGLGDRARVQGRVLGRARRRPGAQRMGGVAVRPAAHARVRGGEGAVRSGRPHEPGQDRAPRMDDASLFRFGRARTRPLETALDWSDWDVRADPARRCRRRGRAAIRRSVSRRPSRCATTTVTAASSTRARCARASASRATSGT